MCFQNAHNGCHHGYRFKKCIYYFGFRYHLTPLWTIGHKYHYTDVIMGTIASQITSLTIVYSTVYSDADQTKYRRSASLVFVPGIHRRPVNSPHKWPITRKMFPYDDVIMIGVFPSYTLKPIAHQTVAKTHYPLDPWASIH